MWTTLVDLVLFLTSIFLILLVLVQRGKGGGLAGALGGVGGYSAFGTRAGDMFTKITIGVASFWLVLAILSVLSHKSSSSVFAGRSAPAAQSDVTDQPVEGLPDGIPPGDAPLLGMEPSGTGLPPVSNDVVLPPAGDAAPKSQADSEPETKTEESAGGDP
jgi:preprotein translocase subunit SecG